MHSMEKKRALLFNLLSVLCWSISPVLVRLVKEYYTVSFQNLFRFVLSVGILWLYVLTTSKAADRRAQLAAVSLKGLKFPIIALFNFMHQFFLVAGIYYLYPGIAALLEESTIIFSVILAFIFFRDERKTIRNPWFKLGLLLTLVGVLLTIGLRSDALGGVTEPEFLKGIVFILISAFAWSAFSLFIRLWVPDVNPALATSIVFSLVVPIFIFTLLLEGPVSWPAAPPRAWAALCASGVIGIGMGYTFYYSSIPSLGLTLVSSLGLLIPLFTGIISFFLFGETMTPLQITGGFVLLCGCYLVTRIRLRNVEDYPKEPLDF